MSDLIGKIKGKIDKGISKVNVESKKLIEKQTIITIKNNNFG